MTPTTNAANQSLSKSSIDLGMVIVPVMSLFSDPNCFLAIDAENSLKMTICRYWLTYTSTPIWKELL